MPVDPSLARIPRDRPVARVFDAEDVDVEKVSKGLYWRPQGETGATRATRAETHEEAAYPRPLLMRAVVGGRSLAIIPMVVVTQGKVAERTQNVFV